MAERCGAPIVTATIGTKRQHKFNPRRRAARECVDSDLLRLKKNGQRVRIVQREAKPKLVLIGGIARSGNHLLRGLLDGVSTLAVPPDEDFFARTLARRRRHQWQALRCRPEQVVPFYQKMQKGGHFERLNSGASENSPNRCDLLDLEKYYERVQEEYRQYSLRHVLEAHFLALRDSVKNAKDLHEPLRVSACPIVPHDDDFNKICRMLTRYYAVKAIVIYRDPLSTYASGKIRHYFGGIERFCESVEWFPEQIRLAQSRYGLDVLPIAFGDMLQQTEQVMHWISAFIRIPFEPMMLACTQNGQPVENNSSFQKSVNIDRKRANVLGPEAVSKVLVRDEIDLIKRRGASFLENMRKVSFG